MVRRTARGENTVAHKTQVSHVVCVKSCHYYVTHKVHPPNKNPFGEAQSHEIGSDAAIRAVSRNSEESN
jgi:hypothetical protein